ncbi:restriction endonuclease [Paenibacillus sp. CC-CFT747]|nr:restriction endonuclease [Paenibacillus sp. CC-CFT747]
MTGKYRQNQVTRLSEHYLPEYCDSCFTRIYYDQLYAFYTTGKTGRKNISIAILSGLLLTVILLFFAFLLINKYWRYNPTFAVITYVTAGLGAMLLGFYATFDYVTNKKARLQVTTRLNDMNTQSEKIKAQEQARHRERQEQAERAKQRAAEEAKRAEQDKQRAERAAAERAERFRREQERKDRAAKKQERFRYSGIREIDEMSGLEFEKRLQLLFSDLGYRAELTKQSGDNGVDVIISKDQKRIAIQAKRFGNGNRVGNSAVQAVCAGSIYYNCSEAWLVTNSRFTEQAKDMAKRVNVRLIDRDGLMELLFEQQEMKERRKETTSV